MCIVVTVQWPLFQATPLCKATDGRTRPATSLNSVTRSLTGIRNLAQQRGLVSERRDEASAFCSLQYERLFINRPGGRDNIAQSGLQILKLEQGFESTRKAKRGPFFCATEKELEKKKQRKKSASYPSLQSTNSSCKAARSGNDAVSSEEAPPAIRASTSRCATQKELEKKQSASKRVFANESRL